MRRRSTITDEELLRGAKAVAADMRLPDGGRLKLARIVQHHLDWFEQARMRGLEWDDIVRLLFRAGATRSDGRPLSRGHVSSLVWRKSEDKACSAATTKQREKVVATTVDTPPKQTSDDVVPRFNGKARGQSRRPEQAEDAALAAARRPDAEPMKPDGDRMLAYMHRVASLRREE